MLAPSDINDGLDRASHYVVDGIEQILASKQDEAHGVSPSPGATALASLALLALGKGFETAQRKGTVWLRQNYRGGWGKFPGDQPDEEITKIAGMVLNGSQGGWRAKLRLLSQAKQFSQMILSLGERVVPGLEGPTSEEIVLPAILQENVLAKLPLYGRPVVVAASVLASEDQEGITKGIQYILDAQMADGSWCEDIIATSLGILAVLRRGGYPERLRRAGQWLVQKQYASGGWPAFDQLQIWSVGWAISVFGGDHHRGDLPWLGRAVEWLKKAQNTDGSFSTTPPYTHPDLDDTAVALMALHQVGSVDRSGINLLKRLQNEDGSWGTFPSFTGVPPNITSEFPVYIPSVDVSIHALEALWGRSRSQEKMIWRGLDWLLSQQDDRGAFPASWFEGDVYSTAQALDLMGRWRFGFDHWSMARYILQARKKTFDFLLTRQNKDGSWGSVIETSLALSGLMRYGRAVPRERLDKGLHYLLDAQDAAGSFAPAYKAVYAKGWSYEEPLTSALTAIRAFNRYRLLYKGS